MLPTVFLLLLTNRAYAGVNNLQLEDLSGCGGEYSGYRYTITSPNYPQWYSENLDCTYVLRGSALARCNQMFHLQFLDFSLRPSEECRGDFVEIGDRSLFCGNVGGVRRYQGRNSTLKIRFHSSKSGNGIGRGFKIAVTTLPCGDSKNSTLHSFNTNGSKEELIPEVEPLDDAPEGNSESQRVDYQHYPVYRPQSPFTIEEPIKSVQLPLTIENPNNSTISTENLQPALRDTKLFSGNLSEKLEIVTGNSVNSDLPEPVKISTYFFAPSETSDSVTTFSEPPPELLLPTHEKTLFRLPDQLTPTQKEASSVASIENQLFQDKPLNQKIGLPSSSYGTPDIYRYTPEIKAGEVLENTRVDCVGKANIYDTQVTSLGNNYPSSVFGSAAVSYPAPSYGPPNFTPNSPTQFIPSGFVPTTNPGNYFPGVASGISQCCSGLYSSQRFFLASPGFPSLIYSANPYQCGYSIAPYSPNICRLRLNFKYFNYGTEDPFCASGHLEIDGRRYCGCKTGLTVVSSVPNLLSKTITVRYVGYPRSKLSGFLIEVVQESCAYNGYPYLSRSKKDTLNVTLGDSELRNVSVSRVRRNLGYSYPMPSVPFEAVSEKFLHTGGVGHVGFSSPARCQSFSLIDWTLAAKETYFRNARCASGGGSGGFVPSYPPSLIPSYPNYPGIGNRPPNYPGVPNIPNYPGNTVPNYPGVGPGVPNYPGINPGLPNYPGNGNGLPNYPGNGNGIPNYPGTGPGYPPAGLPPTIGSCETISVTEGIFSSPFYPNPYPNNVNKCWRFYRAPTACRLQLSFLDFDVEATQGCVKDYLTVSSQNTRYCGRTLAGSKTLLGFPGNNIIDIRFVSDTFGTGKGFTISFAQIPCQVEINRSSSK